VKITAYVDESGRHDRTAKQKGSGQIVVSGWVDWNDSWDKFCTQWDFILKKYDAGYFHFYEWVDATQVARNKRTPPSTFSTNPYKGWNWQKLDDFLYELAEVVGGGRKIFVGGFVSTRDFVEAKKHPDYSRFAPQHGDPYQECLNIFFESIAREIQQQWPFWNEPVSFIFDQNDDTEWKQSVNDAFISVSRRDSRIAELRFEDKKMLPYLPFQAADMIAYRMRQIAEKFTDTKILPNPSKLDDLLIKPVFARASPAYMEGAIADLYSLWHLRYGNYPWRNKTQS
jgi:hypothetical protein